jgi:hypothetical protein
VEKVETGGCCNPMGSWKVGGSVPNEGFAVPVFNKPSFFLFPFLLHPNGLFISSVHSRSFECFRSLFLLCSDPIITNTTFP